MSALQNANALFREGRFEEALGLYEAVQAENPRLRGIAAMNIELIRARVGQQGWTGIDLQRRAPAKVEPRPRDLEAVYAEVSAQVRMADCLAQLGQAPLVSVIVTAHDTVDYIESCIESLVNQNYPRLEIIVVDDCSSDGTPQVLRRLAATYRNVRCRRLNCNLGTYYAKNLGVTEAKGDYVFFQDSDDISHPWRIAVMMAQLLRSGKRVIRGAYCRIDPDTDTVLEVNGLYKKLGLITLGVSRGIFSEVGYFNCTTKASDDEFFQRIQRFVGRDGVASNDLPLYYNTYRENSLFADMVSRGADGHIVQKPSESRQLYLQAFQRVHAESDPSAIKRRFRFPRIRDALPVRPDMTKLANPADKVIVNVASIPERESSLRTTILSVIDQCDQVNVYLDRYESVPQFLQRYSGKCKVVLSRQRPGLRDNGKFLGLEELKERGQDAYYLTIDDDIVYPPDYVNAMLKQIDAHGRKCAVGVHGVILRDSPSGYFSDRRIVYTFTKALEQARVVNLLGTGTLAFHTSTLRGLGLSAFKDTGMADLFFAIHCKSAGVPLLCVARHEGWLVDLNPTPEITLYREFKGNDARQAELVRANAPWGLAHISGLVRRAMETDKPVADKLAAASFRLRSLTR
jgi:glycosyltransferase involved in cell wall biosynthesis